MTPVVFVHWGDTTYLNLAIKQAERYNEVRVVLNQLPVPRSMEIDRWFILSQYMSRKGLDRVVYIDSDVLLFKDVSEDFVDCDMAFSKSHSGHTMFVNNYDALDTFCYYTQKHRKNLDLIWETRARLPGHHFPDSMGDMILLNNFMFSSDYFFRDTAKVYNNSVYDHNINTEGIPEMVDGVPYRDGVRLNSIHFQGGAKGMMKGYINE